AHVSSHLLGAAAQADVRPDRRLPGRKRDRRCAQDLPAERRAAFHGAAQIERRAMIQLEDEQLAAFAPGLDAKFRGRCLEALRAPGRWPAERLARALDIGLERAAALGLSEERSVLAYLQLAVEIAAARPAEAVLRSLEAILADSALTELQRVRFARD